MRFSVVIPTYQRRDLVVRLVRGLEQQQFRDFEVIVVVDGSTDGTAGALRALRLPFPLTVCEQPNRGAAAARNTGAAAATGELLLFLDDDMEADPALLAEHDRSHREGAELVLGHFPLHPETPATAIAAATGRWAERRRARLAQPGERIPVSDLLSGQMSISRSAFARLGGFDLSFTRNGLFGGEDIDLGHRAREAGLRIVFNPDAISYQRYEVDAATYTRRSRQAGRAAAELTARFPEHADELKREQRFATRRSQVVLGAFARLPAAVSWPLRVIAIRTFSRSRPGPRSNRLFFAVQTMERIRGARQAQSRLGSRLAVVLAYHSISDLSGDPVLAEYGVPPERLAAQLDAITRCGFRFIGLDDLLLALEGSRRPSKRSVLVTFDDAYADLLTNAIPVLGARGIPAVAFAVSSLIGAHNEWDLPLGAAELPLLDDSGLRALSENGITLGSHGASHRPLTQVGAAELANELRGSSERLRSLGLPVPTVFSYPYGEWTPEIAVAVRAAGYAAAFTVTPGQIQQSSDRYALPRVEVLAGDTPLRLLLKLVVAGWPDRCRRVVLRGPARRAPRCAAPQRSCRS